MQLICLRNRSYGVILVSLWRFRRQRLAIRLPILNRVFDGLKIHLQWHHWIGLLSGTAMVWHVGQLLWDYEDHFLLLLDLSDFALLTAWIALGLVALAIFLAFFHAKLPYRAWRHIHLVTCLSLVAALIHTLLIVEPRSLDEWTIFLFVATLGVSSILLAVVLPAGKFWGRRYMITEQTEACPDILLLKIHARDGLNKFQYKSGHFIYISMLGPFGTSFWKKDQPELWISYGVGVAIFLAAIRNFADSFQRNIHFICGDKAESNLFYRHELDLIQSRTAHFTWEVFIGSGQDFVRHFPRKTDNRQEFSLIRICGHPGFQKSLKSLLIAQGVKRQTIQLEGLI